MMTNNESSQSARPLRSVYADDETIASILPVFVNNMPRYLADLDARIACQDWPAAARVCHDLKGTAGGYGYPDIGFAAQQLEVEVNGGRSPNIINHHVNAVRDLCARARLGLGVMPTDG